MAKLRWMFMLSVVLAVGGCAREQPIYDVTSAPVTVPSAKAATLTLSQVQDAIIRAGAPLGWQITQEKPGRLTGRLALRTHRAVVDITHDTKTYSIKYRESVDLGEKDGQIHRNYNSWVQNLDNAIRSQLSLL